MVEAPRRIEQAADGLNQLKSLLFQGESRRLDEIEHTLGQIDQRVGDAPRLEKATAEIIVEALRDAEVARHRELADAVAPVVVAAIRNEIRNSRAMMVEALYPLTGQMVVAAVSNAIRELAASLNQRVDALTSVDRWKLLVRSKLTGRPISELALAQTSKGSIVRILFLEAGSGRLIENWRADAQDDDRADLAGGLIAAITGFARDALDAGSNELRTLDFGGRKTYLRNSPQTIVAAEAEGDLTREQIAALDRAFLGLIDRYGRSGVADEASLASFASQVNEAAEPEAKKSSSGTPLKVVGLILLLAFFAFAWRTGARWQQARQIENAIADVIAARPHLAAFPLRAVIDHSRDRVEVKGILPTSADAQAIVAALKPPAGDYAIDSNFALLATAGEIDAVRRDLDGARERGAVLERQLAITRETLDTITRNVASAAQVVEMQARLDAIARAGASNAQVDDLRKRVEAVANAGASASLVADLRTRIETLSAASGETRRLNESVADLSRTVNDLSTRLNAPRARLSTLTEGLAIFFSERDVVLNEAIVGARLDAIAELLKREALGMRVIGHTDAGGSVNANLAISRTRADTVANLLSARGVERRKIVTVARAASVPIIEQDAANRDRNRRVTLELLYENEDTP